MKKVLFSLVALLMSLSAMAATPTQVRITPISGEPIVVHFDDEPEIAFLNDGIKITSVDMEPVTLLFDEVASIDFMANSEVASVGDNVIKMAAYPDRVEFLNVPEGSDVKVYSLAGQLEAEMPAHETVTLYKAKFAKGIHVVVIGKNSFKLSF